MSRRSYRQLSQLPAWGLYAPSGALLGTVRARNAWSARELFKEHAHKLFDKPVPIGSKVRKVGEPDQGVNLLRPTGEPLW